MVIMSEKEKTAHYKKDFYMKIDNKANFNH